MNSLQLSAIQDDTTYGSQLIDGPMMSQEAVVDAFNAVINALNELSASIDIASMTKINEQLERLSSAIDQKENDILLSSVAKSGTKIATLSARNSSVDVFIDEYVHLSGDVNIGSLSLSDYIDVAQDLVAYGNVYTAALSATEAGISCQLDNGTEGFFIGNTTLCSLISSAIEAARASLMLKSMSSDMVDAVVAEAKKTLGL